MRVHFLEATGNTRNGCICGGILKSSIARDATASQVIITWLALIGCPINSWNALAGEFSGAELEVQFVAAESRLSFAEMTGAKVMVGDDAGDALARPMVRRERWCQSVEKVGDEMRTSQHPSKQLNGQQRPQRCTTYLGNPSAHPRCRCTGD